MFSLNLIPHLFHAYIIDDDCVHSYFNIFIRELMFTS
jgi:hypothetical protein